MCLKPIKEEKANDEELKQESIKRLKILKLDLKIVQEFINNDTLYVTHFINNKIFATPINHKFIEIQKAFEHENNVKIYHIINIENNSEVRVYLLFVRDNKLEWKNEIQDLKHGFVETFIYEIDRNTRYIGIETESGKVKNVY